MLQEMIVASRLADGLVVFLNAEGGWTEDFHGGLVLSDPGAKAKAVETAQAAAAANHIVDPYPIELESRAGQLTPKALRERIRAMGPTIRTDLGKQAQHQAPTVAHRG